MGANQINPLLLKLWNSKPAKEHIVHKTTNSKQINDKPGIYQR